MGGVEGHDVHVRAVGEGDTGVTREAGAQGRGGGAVDQPVALVLVVPRYCRSLSLVKIWPLLLLELNEVNSEIIQPLPKCAEDERAGSTISAASRRTSCTSIIFHAINN